MKWTVHGREAYAYTGGRPLDPSLPAVVLIHGAIDDHSVWALQSRSLGHHGRAVLAVDLPGHGRSAGPALASVEALADWTLSLMAAAGIDRAVLVGHSMGSLVALEAAARLGARALGLVMVGTAYPMKVSAALLETALNAPLKAIDMVYAFSISSLASKPGSPGPGSWLHGGSRALMRRLQADYAAAGHGNLFHHDFGVCDRYAGALEAAARLQCPVLQVLGARDAMTLPRAAAALCQATKAARVTLPVGHSLMGEAPDGVLQALRSALAGSRTAPA